ncbi:hypothetical protein GCM10027188_29760 [Lysobacter humi (ex Lee et al. 2017)]
METFDSLVRASLVAAALAGPVLLGRRTSGRRALVGSVIVAGLFAVAWALWPHVYGEFRLAQLGFDPLGMSESERLAKVPVSARAEAQRIENSLLGIGWPLRALLLLPLALLYAVTAASLAGRRRGRVAAA